MKIVVALLVFLPLAAMSAAEELARKPRFLSSLLPKFCASEMDCPHNKCCALGKMCLPKLPKYSTCYLTGITGCGCRDGLECRVTKEFSIFGKKIQLRQCMEESRKFEVEKFEDEEVAEMASNRPKRFLIDRCSSESDCGKNRCCLLGKFCANKIPEDFTCYLSHKHKCGCQDGLECRETTFITVPIIGVKIPIRQCVRPVEPPGK